MTDPQICGSMVHGVWGWFTKLLFLLCYGRRLYMTPLQKERFLTQGHRGAEENPNHT
jgi:hypothetical protein